MAGYLFSLNSLDSLRLYTASGVYATKLSAPSNNRWLAPHEGTFADYATMREGDNIYFFIERKIYGIGCLVNVQGDCKYFNFPGAGEPIDYSYTDTQDQYLWNEDVASTNQRCICVFEPDPFFFQSGIDMDDVLSSRPAAFKMLRAFWKLSFIKFDDEENQAFRDVILKRNQDALVRPSTENVYGYQPFHSSIEAKLVTRDYSFGSGMKSVLHNAQSGNLLRHEMAVEAAILHQLASDGDPAREIFGDWDYLSHQVIASPFKPIDYMDKMDLFGYSYIPGFRPTRSRFLVGEGKRDHAILENIDQLMKYVDWVKDEYCFGDYSMIHAYLVASDFDEQVIERAQNIGFRNYTFGVRPTRSAEWRNLRLVKYWFNPVTSALEFELVFDGAIDQA
jgi:hypothetical protein